MESKINQLLDQYAQEVGYKDMADLKAQYHPRAYAILLPQYVRRAQHQLSQETA